MSESLIFIDKNTSFNGSIEAKQVIVEGNVKGDITASDKVLVKSGGMVNGTIDTDKFFLEEGGSHYGTIRLGYSMTKRDVSESTIRESEAQSEQENKDVDTHGDKAFKKGTPKRLW